MSGAEVLGLIAAVISIVDATIKVYNAANDEASLPPNFEIVATKLQLVSKLLDDAEGYVDTEADDALITTLVPVLTDCKEKATQLQKIFENVIPAEGDSRIDQYSKAARAIGKGGRVEKLAKAVLDDLMLLTTRFPEAVSSEGQRSLNEAIDEVSKLEPSLPDGFEDKTAFAQSRPIHEPVDAESLHYDLAQAPSETLSIPSIMIRKRNKDFVSREIMDQIERSCGHSGSRMALVGFGGIGKTELAIEYAYRVREQFPDTSVFWIHAYNRSQFKKGLQDIATHAQLSELQRPEVNIFQLVHDWLRDDRNGRWIIILDDVDDTSFLRPPGSDINAKETATRHKSARQLDSYIPYCQHGSTLITTKNRIAALELVELANIFSIEPMEEISALHLFWNKLGQRHDEASSVEIVKEFVKAVDYFPLAIASIAAYFSRTPQLSWQQVLVEHRKARQDRRDPGNPDFITSFWQSTFNHIREARSSAADLFSLMSICHAESIPEILLRDKDNDIQGDEQQTGRLDEGFEEDVATLRGTALITADVDGATFRMHRSVQEAARQWLRAEGSYEQWQHRLIERLSAEFPRPEDENWTKCEALFPHVQEIATERPNTEKSIQHWADILDRAACYAVKKGKPIEAENMSILAMKANEMIHGKDHSHVLRSKATLALAYRQAGKRSEVDELDVQIRETHKRKHEPTEQTPTDSGYASGTYEKSVFTRASAEKYLDSLTEYSERAHEDPVITVDKSPIEEQEVQGLELDTTGTIYSASESSTLPPLQDKSYIAGLATELFDTIQLHEPSQETLERISEMLPDLLRAFALKLGCRAEGSMHRDASFFIHKYRQRVRVSFESRFPLDDNDSDATVSNAAEMLEFRESALDRFFAGLNADEQMRAPYEGSDGNSESSDDDDGVTTDLILYRDFIVKTPAYTWLVSSLQREVALTRATPDIMDDIRKDILRALPPSRVSRRVPSQEHKVIFELDWNPLSFVGEQYTNDVGEALRGAITLTGFANNAQTVTTGKYLSQTWPATGQYVIQLVIDVIQNTADHHATSNLPDGSELHARIDQDRLIITTVGTRDSVAEVGQQFAWLGAALRSSHSEAGVATCVPWLRETSEPTPLAEVSYVINFEINDPVSDGEGLTGQDWYNIFRNPVLVSGYPVPAKHAHGDYFQMPYASSFWSMNNVAEVLRRQGKYEEAEQMYRPALERMEKVLGKEHPYTLVSMSNLANVLLSRRNYEAAEEVRQQTLELREKVLEKVRLGAFPSMSGPALLLDSSLGSRLLNFVNNLPATAKTIRLDDVERLMADGNNVNDSAGSNEDQSALHATASHSCSGDSPELRPEPASPDILLKDTHEGNVSALDSDIGSTLSHQSQNHSTFEKSRATETQIASLWTIWVDALWYTSMWILDPPPKNTQRIMYTCGCGDRQYLDVQSLLPGNAEALEDELRAESMAVRRQALGNASQPTPPPQAHLPVPNQPRDQVARDRVSSPSSSIPLRGTVRNIPDVSRNQSPSNSLTAQKFLMICVNGNKGKWKKYQTIDISSITNDEYLFRDIYKAYSGLRYGPRFHIGKHLPKWMHLPKWLQLFFRDGYVFIPKTAEFVRFQLMPIQTEILAGNLVKPELPGEEEVRHKKTYEYSPFPPECKISGIEVEHQFRPGEHLGRFWWKRSPKKLNEMLAWDEDLDCVGWGIHIDEGWNICLVLWFQFGYVSLTVVFVVAFSVLLRDWSAGSGLGALLMAILTFYCWGRSEFWKAEKGQNG